AASCNVDTVFRVMQQLPIAVAPVSPLYEQHLRHCGRLHLATEPLDLFGYDNQVTTYVDDERHSVTNFTRPGHVFYPGQVTRQVVERSGHIVVRTIGTGEDSGWNREMNQL